MLGKPSMKILRLEKQINERIGYDGLSIKDFERG
jgi:hypothetical protein